MIIIYGVVIILFILFYFDAMKNNVLALIALIFGFVLGFIFIGGLYGGVAGAFFVMIVINNIEKK